MKPQVLHVRYCIQWWSKGHHRYIDTNEHLTLCEARKRKRAHMARSDSAVRIVKYTTIREVVK